MADQAGEMENISRRLQTIEARLTSLELAISKTENRNHSIAEQKIHPIEPIPDKVIINEEEDKGLESQIGRFGLAWMGNIVLLVGIIFLTQYLIILEHQFISVLLGYIAAGTIFILANYLKQTNTHLAFMFNMNAQILLYYVTLRLHFFTDNPLLSNKAVSILLLLALVAFQSFLSIRNKSQAFAVLSVLFAISTAVLSDTTHIMLPMGIIAAAGSIYYFYSYNWQPLLVITVFLTYISFIMWFFGDPLMGHPLEMIAESHFGFIYLFGLGGCFSIALLFRKKDRSIDDYLIGLTFTNGVLFTFMLVLIVLRFFSVDYVALFSVITICCLIYSTILHSRSDWNFASAFYALYGFMAMSIALYGLFGFPKVYLLLSVQSLIVVSMALWFRNRLIVVMNSLLFLTILAVYQVSSESINGVNLSFALVALISARIINWQRERLQIKTEILRNLYMIEGFIMILYALFHLVPRQFVTLSWTLAALLYFILSLILKNVKYRYMALGTMISAAIYLFIVDLARIEIIFRVLALLFLAAISIGISIYYTNRVKRS